MTDLHPDLIPFEKARLEALAVKAQAEARRELAEAEETELRLNQSRHEWDNFKSQDGTNRVYQFNGGVDNNTAGFAQATLARWHRLHPGEPFEIVFNSPGGSVFAGMALYDYIRYLSTEGHHITTVCRGMAASMGGILLQAGDTRLIGAESYVLIHEISTLAAGKIADLKDEVAFLDKISERVIDIFVTRSGGKLKAATIKRNWKKTDWWLSSAEALALGIVDGVR